MKIKRTKNCFIVTSSIDVDNNYPIDLWQPGDQRRSDFSNEERCRQLYYTLFNIRMIDKQAKVYVVDTSLDYEKYFELEKIYPNITYYPIAKYNEQIAQETNTNSNKSYCESILLHEFMIKNQDELRSFDFIIKMSGRYVFEMSVQDLRYKKFMFAFKRQFMRGDTPDFLIPSTIYAFDSRLLGDFIKILENAYNTLSENELSYVNHSMETLLYQYTREYDSKILYTGWVTRGFGGLWKSYVWY
jgi:hypothetical protein